MRLAITPSSPCSFAASSSDWPSPAGRSRRNGPATVVRHELGEQPPPLGVRQRHHVVAVEVEEVEHDVADRYFLCPAAHLGGAREVHAMLQPAEARSPVVVERDDFPVEHDGVSAASASASARELGIAVRRVDAVAAQQRELLGTDDRRGSACRPT